MSGLFAGIKPPDDNKIEEVSKAIQQGTTIMLDRAKEDPGLALVNVIWTLGVLLIEHTLLLNTLAEHGFPTVVVTDATPVDEEESK